jgi:hypothetical protein
MSSSRRSQPQVGKTSLLVNPYEVISKTLLPEQRSYHNYAQVRIDIPMHGIVVAATGGGKTQLVWNLVRQAMACWTKIYIFAKDTSEPLYQDIEQFYQKIGQKCKKQIIHLSSDMAEVPSVDDFDPEENNLVVFDDMVLSQKGPGFKNAEELFVRGRRQNVTCLWVTQSFFKTDMILRQNTSYILIKKVRQLKDLKRMLSEYQLDITDQELLKAYQTATATPNSFLLIDLKTNDPALKFRNGFRGLTTAQPPSQAPALPAAPDEEPTAAAAVPRKTSRDESVARPPSQAPMPRKKQ